MSVIDLATAITQKDAKNAARDVAAVRDRHAELSQNLSDFEFPTSMYQRLPYHSHCCSTRDDIGLNTQPYAALLSLSQPFSTILSLSQPCLAFLSLTRAFLSLISLSQPS